MATILTSEERLCYRLYHQTPGLSQKQIARKIGKNQGQISRILDSARAKVEQLKQLCLEASGDPDVVESFLAKMDSAAATSPFAHTP